MTAPPLRDRTKLAYDWLPSGIGNLLDAGCAWGYGTIHFSSKSHRAWGLDIDAGYIRTARSRYPNIEFVEGSLDDTPFANDFFDAIVMNHVLEHVEDEIGTLNEMFRILRPGGTFILSVPHRGLFSFLDKANYGYYIQRYIPDLHPIFLKLKKVGGGEETGERTVAQAYWEGGCSQAGSEVGRRKRGVYQKHRHYSFSELDELFRKSRFNGNVALERVFRSGLIAGVLTSHLEFLATRILRKRTAGFFLRPFQVMAGVDFFIPYGIFSYNISVKLIKKSATSN